MIFRMLGFYPNQATLQYDLNRMTQRTRDYGDAIKEGYIAAYRKADNSAERSRIRGAVKDWNNDAGRDSPFYIRNFSQAANRAARQAKLTSTGRLLSSAPKSVRQFHKDNMIRYGYDTKGIPTDD
jgi:ribosomal protein S20